MSFLTAEVQPADVDKIAIAMALLIVLVAAAFVLGISLRSLTAARRKLLPDGGTAPIGFVHF